MRHILAGSAGQHGIQPGGPGHPGHEHFVAQVSSSATWAIGPQGRPRPTAPPNMGGAMEGVRIAYTCGAAVRRS